VTFIIKHGKTNYTKVMAYRPIFMLKTMEILVVDTHITHGIVGLYPLHRHQFACQSGKSTETALHHVITNYRGNSKVTYGAFLDIEGIFDSTSFDIITKAATQYRVGDSICQQIGSMLGGST